MNRIAGHANWRQDFRVMESAADHPSKNERDWALFAHLSAFSGHFIPFGHILGPLVIWILKRDTMPFVSDQAKESLNFQITMTIALIISCVLILLAVGFILVPAVWLFDIVVTIIAAIKASEGVAYRYPLCLRFLD